MRLNLVKFPGEILSTVGRFQKCPCHPARLSCLTHVATIHCPTMQTTLPLPSSPLCLGQNTALHDSVVVGALLGMDIHSHSCVALFLFNPHQFSFVDWNFPAVSCYDYRLQEEVLAKSWKGCLVKYSGLVGVQSSSQLLHKSACYCVCLSFSSSPSSLGQCLTSAVCGSVQSWQPLPAQLARSARLGSSSFRKSFYFFF